MAYATEFDLYARGVSATTHPSILITHALEVGAERIDAFCRQSFQLTPSGTARRVDGRGHNVLYLDSHLNALEDILVDGVPILAGLQATNAHLFITVNGYRFPSDAVILVVGRWGKYFNVPVTIKEANIRLALTQLEPERQKDLRLVEQEVDGVRERYQNDPGHAEQSQHTTGSPEVDAMLRPYVSRILKIGTTSGRPHPTLSQVTNYGRNP